MMNAEISLYAVRLMLSSLAIWLFRICGLGCRDRKTALLWFGAFAVYMFHPPIIIAVTLAVQMLLIAPVFKWAMTSLICIPLCFLLAYHVLLRVPVLNKIL